MWLNPENGTEPNYNLFRNAVMLFRDKNSFLNEIERRLSALPLFFRSVTPVGIGQSQVSICMMKQSVNTGGRLGKL